LDTSDELISNLVGFSFEKVDFDFESLSYNCFIWTARGPFRSLNPGDEEQIAIAHFNVDHRGSGSDAISPKDDPGFADLPLRHRLLNAIFLLTRNCSLWLKPCMAISCVILLHPRRVFLI